MSSGRELAYMQMTPGAEESRPSEPTATMALSRITVFSTVGVVCSALRP